MIVAFGTDCSGIDAPLQALKQCGVEVDYRFASDINPHSRRHIMATDPSPVRVDGDITKPQPSRPRVDLYCAGFPCPPFSNLSDRNGMADDRIEVMRAVLRHIQKSRPKMFLLENVPGLLTVNDGAAWEYICDAIAGCKLTTGEEEYQVFHRVMSPTDLGFPHRRKRVFIVGISRTCCPQKFEWPSTDKCSQVALSALLLSDEEAMTERPAVYRPLPQSATRIVRQALQPAEFGDATDELVLDLSRTRRGQTPSATLNVVPCMHLTTRAFYLLRRQRYVTPREALRFQGFPDSVELCCCDSAKYQLAGNSMCVPLIRAILKSMLLCLPDSEQAMLSSAE